jgi:hypothetical protein
LIQSGGPQSISLGHGFFDGVQNRDGAVHPFLWVVIFQLANERERRDGARPESGDSVGTESFIRLGRDFLTAVENV